MAADDSESEDSIAAHDLEALLEEVGISINDHTHLPDDEPALFGRSTAPDIGRRLMAVHLASCLTISVLACSSFDTTRCCAYDCQSRCLIFRG